MADITGTVVGEHTAGSWPTSPSRAAEVAAMEKQLLELYADPAVVTKPELLTRRGGAFYSEAAVALIASLLGDRGDTQVVNVRNDGTLPFLGEEAVIEVPARPADVG
ncbi:family 4 glycosyl hydrolase [Nonomuraea maritima]|uniref:family 4 glycosyl hydrolase n=1 Tax=Nonomuraea maritima TaxID=683260 RepID=UPI0037196FF1